VIHPSCSSPGHPAPPAQVGCRLAAGQNPLNLESLHVAPAERLPAAPGPVEKVRFGQGHGQAHRGHPGRNDSESEGRALFQQARPLKRRRGVEGARGLDFRLHQKALGTGLPRLENKGIMGRL